MMSQGFPVARANLSTFVDMSAHRSPEAHDYEEREDKDERPGEHRIGFGLGVGGDDRRNRHYDSRGCLQPTNRGRRLPVFAGHYGNPVALE